MTARQDPCGVFQRDREKTRTSGIRSGWASHRSRSSAYTLSLPARQCSRCEPIVHPGLSHPHVTQCKHILPPSTCNNTSCPCMAAQAACRKTARTREVSPCRGRACGCPMSVPVAAWDEAIGDIMTSSRGDRRHRSPLRRAERAKTNNGQAGERRLAVSRCNGISGQRPGKSVLQMRARFGRVVCQNAAATLASFRRRALTRRPLPDEPMERSGTPVARIHRVWRGWRSHSMRRRHGGHYESRRNHD